MDHANATPRHLAKPRRPWRRLLFTLGPATAILAALVASAHAVAAARTATPSPRRRDAHLADQASPDVRIYHHSQPESRQKL
jgi:hypothetical protein